MPFEPELPGMMTKSGKLPELHQNGHNGSVVNVSFVSLLFVILTITKGLATSASDGTGTGEIGDRERAAEITVGTRETGRQGETPS